MMPDSVNFVWSSYSPAGTLVLQEWHSINIAIGFVLLSKHEW